MCSDPRDRAVEERGEDHCLKSAPRVPGEKACRARTSITVDSDRYMAFGLAVCAIDASNDCDGY